MHSKRAQTLRTPSMRCVQGEKHTEWTCSSATQQTQLQHPIQSAVGLISFNPSARVVTHSPCHTVRRRSCCWRQVRCYCCLRLHPPSQVKQDMARVFSTGWFKECVPDAVDTRDGVKLIIKVHNRLIMRPAHAMPASPVCMAHSPPPPASVTALCGLQCNPKRDGHTVDQVAQMLLQGQSRRTYYSIAMQALLGYYASGGNLLIGKQHLSNSYLMCDPVPHTCRSLPMMWCEAWLPQVPMYCQTQSCRTPSR